MAHCGALTSHFLAWKNSQILQVRKFTGCGNNPVHAAHQFLADFGPTK